MRIILWIVYALLLASLLPGYPTIEPTETCSQEDADECMRLNAVYSPVGQSPGTNVSITDRVFMNAQLFVAGAETPSSDTI